MSSIARTYMSDSSGKTEKPQTPYQELVQVDDRGDYAILTINRPEKRNAMSFDSLARFREALQEVRGKKAVVLTGTGPSFCAGMDLSEAAKSAEFFANRTSQETHPWTAIQAQIRAHGAVFIAAVNGYALGGGSTLIHSCDLAIAAESAKIGAPEMGFGGFPLQAGPAAAKRMAPKHAAELILTARRVDAHEAYRMAIVNKVVPDDQLLAEAVALAEQLAGFDAVALDWGKKTLQRMEDLTWDEAMDYCQITNLVTRSRSDATQQGLSNFVQGKRTIGQGA
ncbi:enoyl-CoA hydratase/isomerase family protein [Nocardia abscessus]|jgi:enoyl-CoA hydratase/carnithine racemase|uniref:enoyl-CoA hydratase/isomerase family protein n=1 Tax=Nocardia abscessus TaxID=120957 RepID=UPI00189379FD|nr:enoyl-CoA hydratase/isomerase family protein [Nocardia abscessus]MBF6472623.1 enoyl-CoA hydratase/isomerase family protein [Nocardia abscessus]